MKTAAKVPFSATVCCLEPLGTIASDTPSKEQATNACADVAGEVRLSSRGGSSARLFLFFQCYWVV